MEQQQQQHTDEEAEVVQNSFSNYYVFNPKNDGFLLRFHYQVKLNQYHCYCYGNTKEGVRCIHRFQFVCMHTVGYDVYLEQEKKVVYVRDLISLRRDFFHFVDRTSLFRSSFLYDPEEKKMFRLHYLHYYLYLPTVEQDRWIPLIETEKKKQILRKLRNQVLKVENSILYNPNK